MVTVKQINNKLRELGYESELVKGDGYFYFSGKEMDVVACQSVAVFRVNQLTLEQWIWEFEQKINS